jgi:DNA polymerase
MKPVVVDFESYYDAELSVSTMGLKNYVAATDAYMVSVVSDEIEFCGTIAELLTHTGNTWMGDPNIQFWAANSNFDQALWEKYFPRTAHPWKCILDRGAFHQLPFNLVGQVHAQLGRKLDKKTRDDMKGVRYESLPDAEQQKVINYCLEDSKQEWDLLHSLPEMSPVEDELAAHTRMMNRRGVHVDTAKVERDLGYLERIKFDAAKLIPWVEFDEAPLSPIAFGEWCRSMGVVPPASLDKRNVVTTAFLKSNPKIAAVVEAMRALRGSNTKLAKLQTLLGTVHNGVMPLEILYCGARHTRRWSSVGFNVQNLDKARAFTDIMALWPEFQPTPDGERSENPPGIFMREYLIPPPGCKFAIIDYSQIEPRGLNWLCGNEEMLTAIRSGYGIYEAHAKATMGWNGAPGTLKHENPKLYQFAKIRVLALGYGMGATRFLDNCDTEDAAAVAMFIRKKGRPPTDAERAAICFDMTAERAAATVRIFRDSNPKITAFWRKFDGLVKGAAMSNARHLEIEMPTGDFLRHFNVRQGAGGSFQSYAVRGDFSQRSKQDSLWGGVLTENVTQRMARDILGEAILRLEKAGFPVIFHAHDEVILAVPEHGAEDALKEASRLMSIAPDWCPDLPLAVEGGIMDHYTKL